ncbi:TPA: hypothetical protein ACX3FU_004500 [Vibrio parahaemolyticus]|uniref:hypothetical protein n=1 Tax=Vibrio alginolyticus TaxID=663 RepID=UPI001303A887|nr:hypothetical protein [Vibrio alginolyticus]EGQ8093377.1 hypothetical protein [Vibrio vulnificus]EGR0247581.1 hypothetical protein [Vibrio parahaemolyticus]EHH0747222.1 hypothetical protein [Vibrio vulnificus]ELP9501587.1 hypothetical protein [Vibrio alginolyticus]ELU9055123.1 hypothetical protein [Vibrio parahaemolyticus]
MKYQSDLSQIPSCPPGHCTREERESFRFVFDPLDQKSFLPQGKKNPQRVHKEEDNETKCSLLGLSMFTSETDARKHYKKLKKFVKNIDKTIGSHLATGTIQPHHGFISEPSKSGHFDLFESAGVDLTLDFQVMYELSGNI